MGQKNISELTLIGAISDGLSLPTDNGIQTYRLTVGQLKTFLTAAIQNLIFSTGDAKITYKAAADAGWILADDGSIGSPTSGATTRANADTLALYTLLWNNTTNANVPVAGGRGASAAADFAANKALSLPKQAGRALSVAGLGYFVSNKTLGQYEGSETHQMTQAEMPVHTHIQNSHNHTQNPHDHSIVGGGNTIGSLAATLKVMGATTAVGNVNVINQATAGNQATTATNQNAGSSDPFTLMQPTGYVNYMIKL